MLKKENRLTKRKEFAFVYRKGEQTSSKYLNLMTVPTKLTNARFGFSISKKIGKAYERNLLKRRLREIVKDLLPKINPKFNYVFIAKPGITQLDFLTLKNNLLYLLTKSEKLVND